MSKLQLEMKAPQFSLSDDRGQEILLSDFLGKKVILYFYPKDNTSGCTQQACDFRDTAEQFSDLNTIIIGVSKDSVKSHQKFKDKFKLPFTLLSDADGTVCEKYNVIVDKSMYGKKYRGIERSTFLIDENGTIKASWRKVKVANHVQEILKNL